MSSDSADLRAGERLQKVLAAAGVASRRVCENYIVAGRVSVNGTVTTTLGTRVDPAHDRVEVDARPVQLDVTKRYVMLNKPTGVVSSMGDDRGRRDLREFTAAFEQRLFNVGRLDYETSGLLLLTNDGELAHVLAHPSFEVTKTYIATVRKVVSAQTIAQLKTGIRLHDGTIRADSARVLDHTDSSSLIEITLHSGRNRIVRRMMDAVGHPVTELVRRQFGPLSLASLGLGETRELNGHEVGDLLSLAK